MTSGAPSSAPIVSFVTANTTEETPAATPSSANAHSTTAFGPAGTCGPAPETSVYVDIRRSLTRPVPSRTTARRLAPDDNERNAHDNHTPRLVVGEDAGDPRLRSM